MDGPLAAGVSGRRIAGWVGGAALVVGLGLYAAAHPIDFQVYHGVGRQVLAGDHALYPAALFDGEDAVPVGFRYPPIVAFAFAPFGLLPLNVAAFLFFGLKIAALAGTITIVGRWLEVPRPRWVGLGAVAILASAGYLVEELRNGNMHGLILFFVVAALAGVERGGWLRPAALLAAAIVIKVTPAVLLVYLVFRRRYRVVGATLVAVVVLLGAPLLVTGVGDGLHQLEGYRLAAAQTATEPGNHALRGALHRILRAGDAVDPRFPDIAVLDLGPDAVDGIWLVAALAILGMTLTVVQRPASGVHTRFLDYAALLTVILVVSPHSQRIYFATLVMPCAVLAAPLFARSRSVDRRLRQALLVAVFGVGTLLPPVLPGRTAALWYEAWSPYVWVAVVLLAGLIHLRRAGEAGPPAGRNRTGPLW